MSAGTFPPNMPDMPQMHTAPTPVAVPKPDLTEASVKKALEKDQEGFIIRHLGFGTLNMTNGESVQGYVVLRALIANHQSWMNALEPTENGVGYTTKPMQSALKGEFAECVYEVWNILEDGTIGPAMTINKNILGLFVKKECDLDAVSN